MPITHPDISAATDVDQTPPTTVRPTLCSCTRAYKYHSLSYLATDGINESLHSMHRNE